MAVNNMHCYKASKHMITPVKYDNKFLFYGTYQERKIGLAVSACSHSDSALYTKEQDK